MSNEMIMFGNNANVPAPSYLADMFGGESNIPAKSSVPQLSIKGKNFRTVIDGEETVMTRVNQETGEPEPISSIKLVVLNVGKRASRTYNSKKYDPNNVTAPDCFSLDGEKPDASIANPQAKTCASCPQSQKGSKISESSGKAITACTMVRRLVVVPAAKLDFEPLLMRLPPTSAWDKNNDANESQGWFAWQQYLDFISSRGVKHTAGVVTMVKFDTTEYPKLLFKPDRFLTQEEAAKVKEVWNGPKVRALLEAKEQDAIGSHETADSEPFEKPLATQAATQAAAQTTAQAEMQAKAEATKAAPVTTQPIGGALAAVLADWDA